MTGRWKKEKNTKSRNRRALKTAALVLGVVLMITGITAASTHHPRYKGLVSDHFDGRFFHNQVKEQQGEFFGLVKWSLTRKPGPWPKFQDTPSGPAPPRRIDSDAGRVTFINHSTVLIQAAGLNILTDPIWSDRTSPVSFAGPKRVHPPGIRFEDLPPIDIVLISHDHYDHMDISTLKRLHRDHSPRFFAGLGTAAYLSKKGINEVTDLDWWDAVPLSPKVNLTAVPAAHFSGRGMTDRQSRLWCGFVLQIGSETVFFAGDTGWGPHFEQIREKFGPMSLSFLPIGAYLPRWFMSPVHLSPAEAVKAHKVLKSGSSVGIHLMTFKLADDGYDQPLSELQAALEAQGISEKDFRVLDFGQGRNWK